MDAKIFRVNYKSDFILTLTSDAGWMTPFCIKFWTGSPMLAYYASYDGETYTHCTYDPAEPTKLTVQFDDHHLPIGNLKYQVAYHFTVADFPENTEDEVTNQANVTTVIDGDTYQVMLDLNGETAPEIQFALPAYANELQRIQNEQTRIAQEQQRINQEQTRISQEAARVTEFNGIKAEALADHQRANEDHSRATSDHQNALADRSQAASDHSRAQSDHTTAGSDHSQANSDHIRAQSDHNTALSDHQTALSDHTQANTDHTRAESDHTRATADSSTAAADHRTASTDHTQANTDHARAESDHQRVETDLAEVEEFSNSLGAYDISAANATGSTLATYPDIATALGPNGSNIPEALRKGGMSVKFVLTYDNKYVQYRYMGTETTGNPNPFLDPANWQGVDGLPVNGSKNFVESGGIIEYTQLAAGISYLGRDVSTSGQNLQYLGNILFKGGKLNIVVKIVNKTATFGSEQVFGVWVNGSANTLTYNSTKGYWYGSITTSETSCILYIRKLSINTNGHVSVAVFTDEGYSIIENTNNVAELLRTSDYIIEDNEQIETLVGDAVASADSITGNYTPISGLVEDRKYVLKLTLNADATVTVATATAGSVDSRVSPYIYTSKYLVEGSHIIEFTYNGGSYLALHDSGLGYSVFSSFVIYKPLMDEINEINKSLMNEINEINGNIVQTIGANNNERQYPSAVCLRNQFEVIPQTSNLLDPNALTRGYISDSNGTIIDHDTLVVTDFIDVTGIELLYFYTGASMTTTYLFFLLAYDANKQPISSSYTQQARSPFTVPNGSKYVRFSYNPSSITSPFLSSKPETTFVPFVGNKIVKGDSTYLRIKEIDDYLQENVKEYLPNTGVSFNQISGKLITSQGVIVDFQNTNYCVSEEITVVEGISYSITANANYNNLLYAFYNDSNTMVGYEQSGSGSSTITSITSKVVVCPVGATKLRIACILPNKSSLYINRVTSKAEIYYPFKDKKWVCIGDSLTEYNQRTSIHYFDYVSKNTGIDIVNLGISGTGYAKGGSVNNFLTRIPSIPLDADVITIFGSFNDLSAGKQLGDIDDDDDTTICGCINLVLDAIQDRVPLVPLGIVSPTPWKNAGPSTGGDSIADNYVNALKRICDYRSIPFMDLYHCSNLHPNSEDFRVLCYSKDGTYSNSTESTPGAIEVTNDNIDTVNSFLADGSTTVVVGDWVLPNLTGCHPNEEGHKLIAGRFETLLKSII